MALSQVVVDSGASVTAADAVVVPVLAGAVTGSGEAVAAWMTLGDLATFFESGNAPVHITSANAFAFSVGLTGATNPAFNVDSSTGSQAAGLNVIGATAAGTVAVAVISSGSAANLSLNAKGTGTISIAGTSTGAVSIGAATGITGATTVTSASASSLAVGLAGATNPAFVVDSSTGSQAAGLSVTGATAAGNVAVAVISSGADANLLVNAKGTGTIGIGTVSTGAVSIVPILGATLKCMVSTTAGASLNLGNAGTAPTSPNNGDLWIESDTIKVRLGGATVTVTTS